MHPDFGFVFLSFLLELVLSLCSEPDTDVLSKSDMLMIESSSSSVSSDLDFDLFANLSLVVLLFI